MDERCNDYARAGIATYITGHRERKRDSGKGNVNVGSAEPFSGQRVKNEVESARGDVELQECRQREKNTCLHGFYYNRVIRGSNVGDCVLLKEMRWTARKVLGHRVLQS